MSRPGNRISVADLDRRLGPANPHETRELARGRWGSNGEGAFFSEERGTTTEGCAGAARDKMGRMLSGESVVDEKSRREARVECGNRNEGATLANNQKWVASDLCRRSWRAGLSVARDNRRSEIACWE